MALIQCPECGLQVSDQAATCPHCGYSITYYRDPVVEYLEARRRNRIIIFLAVLLTPCVLFVLAYVLILVILPGK